METGLYIAEIGNKVYCALESEIGQVAEKAGIAIQQFRKLTDLRDYMKCNVFLNMWYESNKYPHPRICPNRKPILDMIRKQKIRTNDVLRKGYYDVHIEDNTHVGGDVAFSTNGDIANELKKKLSDISKYHKNIRVVLRIVTLSNVKNENNHTYCIFVELDSSKITRIQICNTVKSTLKLHTVKKIVEKVIGLPAPKVTPEDLMWNIVMGKDNSAECFDMQSAEYPSQYGYCGAWSLYTIYRCFVAGETPEQVYTYFKNIFMIYSEEGLESLIKRWWDGMIIASQTNQQ